MTAHVVIELAVQDPEGFQQYVDRVGPLIERAGGRTVLLDPSVVVLEGDWRPPVLVIHEFPGMTEVQAFWDSPEYAPLKDLRRHHATVKVVVGTAA